MNRIKKRIVKIEESRVLSLNSYSSDEESKVDDIAQSTDTDSNQHYPIQLRERKNLRLFFKLSHNLVTLDLRNCSISNADVLEACIHLRFACLAENYIEQVPSCLPSLKCLQFFDLSSNKISSPKGLMILRNASPTLLYLNLIANPVTRLPRYRSFVIGAAKSLLALDNHLISDEELIPNAFFRSHFSAGHKRMQINMSITKFRIINKEKHVHLYVDILQNCLKRFHACNSPIIIIQQTIRAWLTKLKTLPRIWAITKLQAYYRGKLHRQRIRVEMNKILLESWRIAPHVQTIDDRKRMGEQARVVQYYWRRHHKLKIQTKSITLLQRWMRRNLKRKSDALKWFDKFGIAGFFFPEYYKKAITNAAMYRKKTAKNFLGEVKPILNIKLYKYTTRTKNWKKQTFCFLSYRSGAQSSGVLPPLSPTKTTLAERIKWISRYTARRDKWIAVSSSAQIKSMSILKARGVHFSKNTLKGFRKKIANDVNDFRLSALPLIYYRPKDVSDLYQLTQSLWKTNAVVPIYWDVQVFEDCASAEIQRVWRGSKVRRVMLPFMVTSLLRLRGAVAIQRWWRTTKGLISRLHLLKTIADVCRGINTPFLYFDAWVFYLLLQCQQRSPLTCSMSQYPEFIGNLLDDIQNENFFFSIPSFDDLLLKSRTNTNSQSRMNGSSSLEEINSQTITTNVKSNSSNTPGNQGMSPKSPKIENNSPKYDFSDTFGNKNNLRFSEESLQKKELNNVHKITTPAPSGSTPIVLARRVGVPKWFTWCRVHPKNKVDNNNNDNQPNNDIDNNTSQPQIASSNDKLELCNLNKLMSKYCEVNVKKVPELANYLLSQYRNNHAEKSKSVTSPTPSNKSSRRYLLANGSDSLDQSSFRIIEMKFSSIEEARRRCTLIMLMTYDSAHRMNVIPMSSLTLQQRLKEKLHSPMQDLPIYYNPKSWHDKRQSRIRSQLTSSIHKFMESNSEILPFEMRMVISEVSPWVILQQWDLRDVLRFRFLCEALKQKVISSEPQLVNALHQINGNSTTELLVKKFPPVDVIYINESKSSKSLIREDTIKYTSDEIDVYQALVKDKVIYSSGNKWNVNGAATTDIPEIDWQAASATDLLIIVDTTQSHNSNKIEEIPPPTIMQEQTSPSPHINRITTLNICDKPPKSDDTSDRNKSTFNPSLSYSDSSQFTGNPPSKRNSLRSNTANVTTTMKKTTTATTTHPTPPTTTLRPTSSSHQMRCSSAGNTTQRYNRILTLSSQQQLSDAGISSHDITTSTLPTKPYLSQAQEIFDHKNIPKRQLEAKDLAVATRLEKLQSLHIQQIQDEQRLLKEIEEQKKKKENYELHRKAMNNAIKLDNSNTRDINLLENPEVTYADKLIAMKAEEVKQVRETTRMLLNKIREDNAFYCDNRNLIINEETMSRQTKREELTADRNKKLVNVIAAKHNHFYDISTKKNENELKKVMENSAAKSNAEALKISQKQKKEARATVVATSCLFTAISNRAQSEFRKTILESQAEKLKDKVRQCKVTRHRSQMIRSALFQREKLSVIDDDVTIEVQPISPRSFEGDDVGGLLAGVDEETEEGNSTSLFSKRPIMKKRANVIRYNSNNLGTDESSSNKTPASKATSGIVSKNTSTMLSNSRMNSKGDLMSHQASSIALQTSRGERGSFHHDTTGSSTSIAQLNKNKRRGSVVKTVISEHQSSSLLFSESSKGISSETSERDIDEESSLDMKSSNEEEKDSDDDDDDV